MSDDRNTQYGNEQIKADLFELKQAVANMEARVEPLQDFTNKVNQILQRLDAVEDRINRIKTALAMMDQWGRWANECR